MLAKSVLLVVGVIGTESASSGTCTEDIMQQYRDSARVVDSLHVEKNGQARVVARDGSEFTAGQTLWMQAQLRKVVRLCSRGGSANQAGAQRAVVAVQDLLRSRRRS